MAVFIFALDVLQLFTNDEKSWVRINYAVIPQCVEILFFARSLPVSQNLYGQSRKDFHIFLAMKYASFGHSAYCGNHYGRLSHLREKYGKSPPKILSIFTSRQRNFSPNAFFRFI